MHLINPYEMASMMQFENVNDRVVEFLERECPQINSDELPWQRLALFLTVRYPWT